MPKNPSVYGHDAVRPLLRFLIVTVVAGVRSLTLFGGAISVLFLDIIFGSTVLSLVILHDPFIEAGPLVVKIGAGTICTMISVATTGIQLVTWDLILSRKSRSNMVWLTTLGLVIFDTLCDISLVPWLMYHESPENIIASHPTRLYWIVVCIVAIIAALDSYLITIMIGGLQEEDEDENRSGHSLSGASRVHRKLVDSFPRFGRRDVPGGPAGPMSGNS